MIASMFRGLGRFAVIVATMAFLSCVSLMVLGSFLMTWPILRLSPRDRRLKVTADLIAAMMTAVTTFSAERMRAQADAFKDTYSSET